MPSYISQSALQDLIREVAATHCPGIAAVRLGLAEGRPNWRVFRVDGGTAERGAAMAAVEFAVAANRGHWIMVDDEDPRDGRPAT